MNGDGALRYLGLARKAGKLAVGADAVCDALRRGRAKVVFAADGISESTGKRLSDKCAFYGAELLRLPADGETLAHAVGKTGFVAAAAITEAGLTAAAKSALFTDGGFTGGEADRGSK